ncbi:PREDICTED: D-aspartate oxidase-like [Acropora digitifera]|uniref:D-aspartate oxidase-like n=1 Tax=Acropora digitifera TaxID=70779 RepID=UPI00077A28DB|nr:PREDICTED: D-aspartate oxidase-like [Acropora digitifera]
MGSVGVVGAGIIGLSSAVCILERDPTVKLTVIADKFTPNTTSDGAAGLIMPIHMGNTPVHLQRKWFKATMEELETLSQRDDAGSYLTIYKTTSFDVTDESCEDPFWADLVDGYRHLSQKELAQISKTAKFGYSFTTWFFNGRNYLPWLIERFSFKKFQQARMINAWVGLRPGRNSARLEKEEKRFRDKSGKEACLKIVHNYGHGGSGLTMHWGCALDTADLVFEFLAAHEQLNSKL